MINFFNRLKFSTSEVARNITIVFSGNVFASGIGFFTVIIISKYLSISDFGVFSIAISILHLSRFMTNLGINSSAIKFASSYLGEGKADEGD